MKKVLLIFGIVAIVGIVLFLVFGGLGKNGSNVPEFSIADFMPFGDSGDAPITEESPNQNDQDISGQITTKVPSLRKISSEPVAGSIILGSASTTIVRFVEKGTGNVYEANSTDTSIKRLSNTTIPKIIRAFWLPDGSGFLAQTIEVESELIETSLVKLNKNSSTSSVETLTPFGTTISKLPTGIKELSISPDGKKVFYYTTGLNTSDWFISNVDGTSQEKVFTHPLTEWIPKWISTSSISMQTKSNYVSTSFNYIFDTKNKTLKKVGYGLVGLSSNPNIDGEYILSSGGTFSKLYYYSTKNNTLVNIYADTFAEKCVWLKKEKMFAYCAIPRELGRGNYPDVWYKGLISTDDFIEKIDISQNAFYRIANLSEIDESEDFFDVYNIDTSKDDSHITFINKNDGFLWIFRVSD